MNKRTNLGNIYLEKTYINTVIIVKANTTSLIKKNGTNWGIVFFIVVYDHVNTSDKI